MRRNLLLYQRALFLRKKKGYSYREIQEELPVAKSTLSGWLSGIQLTESQLRRIENVGREKLLLHNSKHNIGEWNRKKRHEEITKIRVEAKQELPRLSDRELLVAGIMLYWAEGSKSGKTVRISNADPVFIKFIMKWFRESLSLSDDQFTARIHYHIGQNEMQLRDIWSEIARIPLSQFRKGFCKPPGTGHRKHYLQWGVLNISISKSADLLHRIFGWRDGLIEEIVSGKHKVRL